ncbi:hypothetical protein HJC23_006222 [Cyclotella cryptica]|uniref:Uncharacterized protein n=1 Tax=Cyclotella cryptica TaxID=29204 RepID=A0ABD3PW45_9STRA|eukprot:CCRYP_010854-RA/>CCRYP_010854-RA protein AED:0.00 eAED:0.00 QI:762/1/1/1/1/1/2/931/356
MALQYYPSVSQSSNRLKRKHIEVGNISNVMFESMASSILANIDWVDHVVADVSTHEPAKIIPKPPLGEQRLNAKSSLQDFFINMMKSRGYSGSTYCTLTSGYNNKPSQHQISSYGVAFTKAIRSSNLLQVRKYLFEAGLNPNACNKFGESVVHLVCRQRNHDMLGLLLEAGCSVQVCDDFGRTPLHDACWTSSPNFKLISMLLDQDPWLLCLKDCRGSTPLGYVKDESHYSLWVNYLEEVADKYWPCVPADDAHKNNAWLDKLTQKDSRTPPLVLMEPNSRPIPTPELLSSLSVIERVANGSLQPGDIKRVKEDNHQTSSTKLQCEKNPARIRISLEHTTSKGALSAKSLVPSPEL